MSGGPSLKIPDKVEPRLLLMAILLLIVAVLTLASDQAAFAAAPEGLGERLLALIPSAAYWFLQDRMLAFAVTGGVYLIAIFTLGLSAYRLVVEKFVEPTQIREMIASKRREKDLLNKYGDDTL